jgi:hypothetical protein
MPDEHRDQRERVARNRRPAGRPRADAARPPDVPSGESTKSLCCTPDQVVGGEHQSTVFAHYIRQIVDEAPTLDDDQRVRLSALLRAYVARQRRHPPGNAAM